MPRADHQQALESILRNPAIWRAEAAQPGQQSIATAHPALDQALPERGWPVGVLTELLVNESGAGELALLAPALRTICTQGRGIALLAPPYLPHARAWEAAGIALDRMLIVDSEGVDLLWAAEQVLRSGECGAVVIWSQAARRALNNRALQRLQLAAGAGNALCFLYRPVSMEASASPAPLRIRLSAQAGALQLQLVKCRGTLRTRPVLVQPFPAHWQESGSVTAAARAAGPQRNIVAVPAVAEVPPGVSPRRVETLPAAARPGSATVQTSRATSGLAATSNRPARAAQFSPRPAVPDTSAAAHTHSV